MLQVPESCWLSIIMIWHMNAECNSHKEARAS
jgi:hypothetical protein